MHVFDRIDPQLIERRSAQLCILAIASIVVLSAGIALMMYPAVFSQPVAISGATMRRLFFAFCALSALLVGYLTDSQMAIQELRERLSVAESRNRNLTLQASVDLLGILPNFEHFQDRLSMEFRRAVRGLQPLSLVAISLTPGGVTDSQGLATAYGNCAKSIIGRLRREDSIYCLREGVFGVILPGASAGAACRVADRLSDGLREVSGRHHAFAFELKVINYPENACSAREIENLTKAAFAGTPALARAA